MCHVLAGNSRSCLNLFNPAKKMRIPNKQHHHHHLLRLIPKTAPFYRVPCNPRFHDFRIGLNRAISSFTLQSPQSQTFHHCLLLPNKIFTTTTNTSNSAIHKKSTNFALNNNTSSTHPLRQSYSTTPLTTSKTPPPPSSSNPTTSTTTIDTKNSSDDDINTTTTTTTSSLQSNEEKSTDSSTTEKDVSTKRPQIISEDEIKSIEMERLKKKIEREKRIIQTYAPFPQATDHSNHPNGSSSEDLSKKPLISLTQYDPEDQGFADTHSKILIIAPVIILLIFGYGYYNSVSDEKKGIVDPQLHDIIMYQRKRASQIEALRNADGNQTFERAMKDSSNVFDLVRNLSKHTSENSTKQSSSSSTSSTSSSSPSPPLSTSSDLPNTVNSQNA